MSDQKKKFLTTGEMAKDLGAAPRTVAGWCDGGKLQHYRLPTNGRGEGDRRIPINQAIKFCQDNGVPVPQSWVDSDVRITFRLSDQAGFLHAVKTVGPEKAARNIGQRVIEMLLEGGPSNAHKLGLHCHYGVSVDCEVPS